MIRECNRWPHFNIQCENRDSFPKDSQYYCVVHLHAIVYLCHTFFCEEENQKLKEMIQSLGAGRTVDAQTFEDLGRKSGNPEHQTRLQAWNATLQKWTISDDGNCSCSSISQHVVVVNHRTFYSWLNIWIDMDSWIHHFWLLAGREKSQRRRLHWRPWNVLYMLCLKDGISSGNQDGKKQFNWFKLVRVVGVFGNCGSCGTRTCRRHFKKSLRRLRRMPCCFFWSGKMHKNAMMLIQESFHESIVPVSLPIFAL